MKPYVVAVAAACAAVLSLCPGAAALGDRLPGDAVAAPQAAPSASASGGTGSGGGRADSSGIGRGGGRERIGRFNPTDAMFLQMMVAHSAQGVAIARRGALRGGRPEVRALATTIASAQKAEAEAMLGWLRLWHLPRVARVDSHAAHGGMPGVSAPELAALDRSTGPDFERRFLNMMIAQHDDAIQLTRLEAATGANPLVRDLARHIDATRSAQIKQMLRLLG